jgi:hypothetical protein
MVANDDTPRKLSRQQLRAMERERRTATAWIAALGTDDQWLRQAIRAALGTRAVTRAELEDALGMSLAETTSPHGTGHDPAR